MAALPKILLVFALSGFAILLSAQETESDSDSTNRETNDEDRNEAAVSAMPPKKEKPAEIPDAPQDDLEELREIEVEEDIGPDPEPLLDDPLILKTEKERKRELIEKHMDLASQILNAWTIPLLGQSLAEYAEEAERRAELEAFKQDQQRNLEALKKVDKDLYREKREEYYDTVIRAQGDRWDDPSDSTF